MWSIRSSRGGWSSPSLPRTPGVAWRTTSDTWVGSRLLQPWRSLHSSLSLSTPSFTISCLVPSFAVVLQFSPPCLADLWVYLPLRACLLASPLLNLQLVSLPVSVGLGPCSLCMLVLHWFLSSSLSPILYNDQSPYPSSALLLLTLSSLVRLDLNQSPALKLTVQLSSWDVDYHPNSLLSARQSSLHHPYHF